MNVVICDLTGIYFFTDSDGYLTPSAAKKRSGSLHDEEYLAPTFNQFKRINSRGLFTILNYIFSKKNYFPCLLTAFCLHFFSDLTPPHEDPPPIPMESYISVRKHSE